MDRIRVCAVLTHPVQYYAAWFRWIHAHGQISICTSSTPHRPRPVKGTGFDREFVWDVPLTDGYECTIVRAARPAESLR
jgi:hypothetical protein